MIHPKKITDPEVLKKNLIEYHREGIAFDFGEMDIDVHTVAVPIFNYEKKPVAAAGLQVLNDVEVIN
jgi:DNA-binding IclR family transcriptional regulator